MTKEREAHLIEQARKCACLIELDTFRKSLSGAGELTAPVMAAIRDRQDALAHVSRR